MFVNVIPLTAHYSKWGYSEKILENDIFIKTNWIITAFWTVVYILQSCINTVEVLLPQDQSELKILSYLLLIPAILFTKRILTNLLKAKLSN